MAHKMMFVPVSKKQRLINPLTFYSWWLGGGVSYFSFKQILLKDSYKLVLHVELGFACKVGQIWRSESLHYMYVYLVPMTKKTCFLLVC